MRQDVVDIRDFYNGPLGRVARRMIRRGVRHFWPDVSGRTVLGLGYATPFLDPLRNDAERIIAAMPAQQGVLHWPTETPGLTTLVDETDLPFDDLSMDRIILVHALETADHVQPMMREIWRVLSGGGKLLVVTPNRRGIWARFERTPFGHGQPYSAAQLSRLLRNTMFTPIETRGVLFAPPSCSRMVLSAAPALETIGQKMFKHFSGVIMTEATKQIYAGHEVGKRAQSRVFVHQNTPGAMR